MSLPSSFYINPCQNTEQLTRQNLSQRYGYDPEFGQFGLEQSVNLSKVFNVCNIILKYFCMVKAQYENIKVIKQI